VAGREFSSSDNAPQWQKRANSGRSRRRSTSVRRKRRSKAAPGPLTDCSCALSICRPRTRLFANLDPRRGRAHHTRHLRNNLDRPGEIDGRGRHWQGQIQESRVLRQPANGLRTCTALLQDRVKLRALLVRLRGHRLRHGSLRRAVIPRRNRHIPMSQASPWRLFACERRALLRERTLDSLRSCTARNGRAWACDAHLESGLARVYDLISVFQQGFGYLTSERPRGAFVDRERIFRRVLTGKAPGFAPCKILST
jgi:hypothetical protein